MWLRTVRWVALVAVDLGVLVGLRPTPHVLRELGHPSRWVSVVGSDRAAATLAGLALWAVAAWVGLGLVIALLAAAPGGMGRAASGLARRTLPRALHQALAGGLGLSVLLTPIAAGAAPTRLALPVAATDAPTPAPNWPAAASIPTPVWPAQAEAARAGHSEHHPRRVHQRRRERAPVTVGPGESLWSIAAEHLPTAQRRPGRIAAMWPRWYAANRAVIGADPDLIRPGLLLRAPTPPTPPSPAEEPAS